MSIELHNGGSGLSRGNSVTEPKTFEDTWRLAQILAKTQMFGLTTPENAFVVLATGMELGIPAMTAPRGIYVIDGKPSLYAQMMVALVRSSGACAMWRIVERTRTRCVIEAKREGESEQPVTFTWTIERAQSIYIDSARKVPLTSKATWQNDPEGMLYNRCASEVCRVLFSDVTLNLYTPEELETRAFEVIDAKPAPRATVALVEAMQPSATVTVAPSADTVETWRARFAAVTTKAELDALRKEVPAHLKGELGDAFKAAKARVEGPKDDGPKGGQKPVTGEHTQATGSGEHVDASEDKAPSQAILLAWINHCKTMTAPQHVINSVAAHIGEFAESMRPAVIEAAASRARSFTAWAAGKDIEALIHEAIAAKGAAA